MGEAVRQRGLFTVEEGVRRITSLPADIAEMAILLTGRHWKAQYEFWAHARLARKAGLDPTSFNPSKRNGPDGRPRWPTMESIDRVLNASGATLEEFTDLLTGRKGQAPKRKQIPLLGFARAGNAVTYFDGVEIVKNEIMVSEFDLIVVDEASAYKNAQTTRWKTLRDVVATTKGIWMLTGTPAAQSPVDAFGLAKLINPINTPKFFGEFRDRVMYKVGMYRWLPKADAQQTVHKVLQPAIRFEKNQCLDLPDLTFVERDAPLTAQQSKFYKMLKKQMVINAAGESISAVNAATNINKLLQISGGAVYSDNGEVIEFDVSNRLNVIEEVIEEASHKVLVFVPFTHTIELLRAHLTKAGISCDVINGQVPVNRRHTIIQDFQDTDNVRVLIIQPQAASHGLTLTAANVVVWYAPVTSVETYLQANARINRPGQKNPMTVVHITGSEVEARLYKMLQNNINNHEKIIDLYKQEIENIA